MSASPLQPPPTAPALLLAERWGEFTKVFSIYPAANVRVQQALGVFRNSLAEAPPGEEDDIEVLFHQDAVTAGGETLEIRRGSTLSWLSERIHAAALAGVGFAHHVEDAALLAFTQRLLGLYTRKRGNATFATLWPEDWPGIRLIERRFAGTFQADGVEGGGRARSWGDDGAEDDEFDQDDMVQRLVGEQAIAGPLLRLQAHLQGLTRQGETTQEYDVLQEVLAGTPSDVARSYGALVEIIASRLGELEERLDGKVDPTSDAQLNARLARASRSLLGHEGAPQVTVGDVVDRDVADSGLRGHAGDDEIADDAGDLLLDMSALPAPWSGTLTPQNLSRPAEMLGAYLHCLLHVPQAEAISRVGGTARQLLEHGEAASRDVLRQYVEATCQRADGEEEASKLLLELVRDLGEGRMLRSLGLLDAEVALQRFPQHFALYLDALDSGDPRDRAELAGLCRALGPERFTAAEEALVAEGLVAGDHVTRHLGAESPALGPLCRLLLVHGRPAQRTPVVEWMRRVYKGRREAGPLLVADRPEVLPTSYLLRLLDSANGESDPDLIEMAAGLLCARIRETRGQKEQTESRTRALRALARLPSAQTFLLAREIVEDRHLGVMPAEPRAVRQAAREILEAGGV